LYVRRGAQARSTLTGSKWHTHHQIQQQPNRENGSRPAGKRQQANRENARSKSMDAQPTLLC
jgi:hypothetical protein